MLRNGLIPEFKYNRSPVKQVICWPPQTPLAINFITGRWLEIFVYKILEKFVRENEEIESAIIAQRVVFTIPGGDRFDLDAVIITKELDIIWIEAKTSKDFNYKLPKYKIVSEAICRDKKQAILLCPALHKGANEALLIGESAQMTVSGLDDFEATLREALGIAAIAGV